MIISLVCCMLVYFTEGQQQSNWSKWNWLMGNWKGEGNGEPGKGSGIFSLQPDLNEQILVRKAHSAYPAAAGKPEIVHDDLMVIYKGQGGDPEKAIYFDNEGHTINYLISLTEKEIILLSEKIPGVPVFRLTYTLIDPETINVKFEMSRDAINFMTYVEGRCKKIK